MIYQLSLNPLVKFILSFMQSKTHTSARIDKNIKRSIAEQRMFTHSYRWM